MADTILREFFLGFVRIHILHHAAEEGVYGLGMIGELGRHGYSLSPGTIYPLLHSMEHAGYLTCEPRHVDGRPRKYYTITPRGREVLAEAQQKIGELTGEVSPKPRRRKRAN
ncbi:MAG: PadR family transcriptional regulator [Dehalococcoidia bacterium]